MLQNFPKALPDELLGSLLARSARQLGIKDDKVALELFFGSRNVVPSGLIQGINFCSTSVIYGQLMLQS